MFFEKNNSKKVKCEGCGSRTEKRNSFCPTCGNSLNDTFKEKEDFGLLGKDDFSESDATPTPTFSLTDKLINSIFNSMMKNLDKQFKNQFKDFEKQMENAEVKTFPNGIKIKISGPFRTPQKRKKSPSLNLQPREIHEEQAKKMFTLPREKAKTNVKRIGDKVVYELTTPGVNSTKDIFVSKLESGYEIKAIGNKKIYVNSIPLNLPLKKYSILKNKLFFEFNAQEEQI